MRKIYIIILSTGISIFLVICIILFISYYGKIVHLSFDDVSICMKDLTKESSKYRSIFQHPFLRELKDIHEATGAKFTLYIYEQDEVKYMSKRGISTLLSADDDRVSYSLNASDNAYLVDNELLTYEDVKYDRTDIRVEKDVLIAKIFLNANDDKLVVFTHEWAYDGTTRLKYRALINLLSFCNSKFEN